VNSSDRHNKYREAFERKKCCVVIPTYNNARFIENLLHDVLGYCKDVIVVNDGCTDHTLDILAKFEDLRVITFPKNMGKGRALKAGFHHAQELDFEYAITLDSDNQHAAKDLPSFLKILDEASQAIVIGSRQLKQENVPGKNRFANWLSNFWFKIETGIRLRDTQSGFRLYPLRAINGVKTFSSRYEFELEILVKASWKGIRILDTPIDVYYPPQEDRVTHFRPWVDFLRISMLNTLLVFLGLLYYRPRLMINKYRKKSLKQIFQEDIIKSEMPRYMIALSIAFGIFMGIFPVWGYQLVIGFFFAHLFKLNKAIFFIAANISIPPMIPLILYLSYVTGSYVLGEGSWKVDIALNIASIGLNLKQYLTGAIVFATIAGIGMGALSYAILILFKRAR
jgi:glycosyltransferase involved in cell wall biosynthesis